MTKEKLKFGLVGAGGIAQAYGQAFPLSKSAQLVGIADVRADVAQALAQGVGASGYDDYQTMAQTSELDAVVI